MWWKNVKLMALLVVVVVFLMYIFVGFGCGLPGKLTRRATTKMSANDVYSMAEMHEAIVKRCG